MLGCAWGGPDTRGLNTCETMRRRGESRKGEKGMKWKTVNIDGVALFRRPETRIKP